MARFGRFGSVGLAWHVCIEGFVNEDGLKRPLVHSRVAMASLELILGAIPVQVRSVQ